MENNSNTNTLHLGRKIERIRRLRGMTQTELGDLLGVSKQAVSKMERMEKIEGEKLKQVAVALGVTPEGIKKFREETVLFYTNNFYKNSKTSTKNIVPAATNVKYHNHFSRGQAVKLFEELLRIEKERFETLKKEQT